MSNAEQSATSSGSVVVVVLTGREIVVDVTPGALDTGTVVLVVALALDTGAPEVGVDGVDGDWSPGSGNG